MNKRIISSLAVLAFCLVLQGCVQPRVKIQVDGLSPNEISIIRTENEKISIIGVDDKQSVGFLKYMFGGWPQEVSLRPGKHKFNIIYSDYPVESKYLYNVDTRAGSTYMVKHQPEYRGTYVWFENMASGEPVSETVASMNEPITDKNNLLAQSVYFTLEVPPEEGWVVMYRDNKEAGLAREGGGKDETYALSVFVFEIPSCNSKEEFMDFVKDFQGKDADAKRFNVIENETEYVDEMNYYCVRYHTVAEDKKPTRRSWSRAPMLLEMVGYICRHPENKNIGIVMDYSQRAYPGHQDEGLEEKAREIFGRLTF